MNLEEEKKTVDKDNGGFFGSFIHTSGLGLYISKVFG
jgi:hypothetical protein